MFTFRRRISFLLCWVLVIVMFYPQVQVFATTSAYGVIQAEAYDETSIEQETCKDVDGGVNVYDWQRNGYLRYDDIDFGSTGALGFEARVADFSDDCDVEIIMDSLSNDPVGTLHIFSTGKEQDWETQSCPISQVTGVHTVYLKFKNNYAKASMNYFRFLVTAPEEQIIPSYSYTPLPSDWEGRDTMPDTWAATDSNGNTIATNNIAGNTREEKYVGIFYHLFLTKKQGGVVYDNTSILNQDYFNPSYGPNNTDHFWGKPIFDYYQIQDTYVIEKHAQLLYNAGVDVIFFDTTNAGFPFAPYWSKIVDIFYQLRLKGINTPQIAFHTGDDTSNAEKLVPYLYDNIYSQDKYKELWFLWEGKPIILGNSSTLSDTYLNTFTFRRSWAWQNGEDQWPWLDNTPQGYGWSTSSDTPEATSVNLAQHATTNKGKSNSNGVQKNNPTEEETASLVNFDEQWQRALEIDPQFIFVTAWNEWVASRYPASEGQSFLGRTLSEGDPFFVDEYNTEYSRDIEPSDGILQDNAYMMLAHYIRLFKGARSVSEATGQTGISVNTDFSQWGNVGPDYLDSIYDTNSRDTAAYANYTVLENYTGRNDIDTAKVSHDSSNIYFYVKTREALTTPEGSNWMSLLINSDNDSTTGWNGYDYILNHTLVDSSTGKLQRNVGNEWEWEDVTNISFCAADNELHLSIPRSVIGLTSDPLKFQFKWADNITDSGEIMEFYTIGDVAPDGRFSYQYVEETEAEVSARPGKTTYSVSPAEEYRKYEAEYAVRSSGLSINSSHTGYSGTGFTEGFEATGNELAFTINNDMAGIKSIKIRYANGQVEAKSLSLYVNGTKVQQLSFPVTESTNWDAWGTITCDVSLTAGKNIVTLRRDGADTGKINVDYLGVSQDGCTKFEAESGSKNVVASNTDKSGYSGSGFTDNWSSEGASNTIYVNAPQSNSYTLKIRYANAQLDSKTLSLYINGNKIKQLVFPVVTALDWNSWGEIEFKVSLNEGSNTIKLQYDSNDSGNINIDYYSLLQEDYIIYQAETGIMSGGAGAAADHDGYVGTGFTDSYTQEGAMDTITVEAPVTGYYHLKVRYANGQADDKSLSLYVNGNKVRQLTFPVIESTNWDVWSDIVVEYCLELNEGSNTIALSYDAGDSGNVNIDSIGIN